MTLLDEAFALLEESQRLERKAAMDIDPNLLDDTPSVIIGGAADKMFEACYLFKQHLRTLSQGNEGKL